MTREEAIKLLKEYAPRIKPFYEPYRTEYPQAIDMAIEALSADKISRAELFNRLAVIKSPAEANEYKAEVYKIINEL